MVGPFIQGLTGLILNPTNLIATKGPLKGPPGPFPRRLHLREAGRAGHRVRQPFPGRPGCPTRWESSHPAEAPRRNVCSGLLPLQ